MKMMQHYFGKRCSQSVTQVKEYSETFVLNKNNSKSKCGKCGFSEGRSGVNKGNTVMNGRTDGNSSSEYEK